eukprot:GHRQ01025001.1.p1 GENE.GHRQ01025001.1~~GHRQ01025001.1.p1  ORF type:complete len:131 (+),score=11.51 GHRQ01025001.1:303-695(+)
MVIQRDFLAWQQVGRRLFLSAEVNSLQTPWLFLTAGASLARRHCSLQLMTPRTQLIANTDKRIAIRPLARPAGCTSTSAPHMCTRVHVHSLACIVSDMPYGKELTTACNAGRQSDMNLNVTAFVRMRSII